MSRLSRAVVVLSGFWMVGATTVFAAKAADDADYRARTVYEQCLKMRDNNPTYNCLDSKDAVYRSHSNELAGGIWGTAAFQAAVLLALGLTILGAAYWSLMWIMRG